MSKQDEMPDVIYANKYPHRDDSGMWFDKRVNHPAMPQERFIKASKAKQDKLDLLDKVRCMITDHYPKFNAVSNTILIEIGHIEQEIEG